jgi:hypothetical protein
MVSTIRKQKDMFISGVTCNPVLRSILNFADVAAPAQPHAMEARLYRFSYFVISSPFSCDGESRKALYRE